MGPSPCWGRGSSGLLFPGYDTSLGAKANLRWLKMNGDVQTGAVVHREGAGEGNPSCPVVVMSELGAVQEQGVGVHDMGAVALKNRTTSEDVFHSYFVI